MRVQLFVRGTVQGVGFRPFVYREATRLAVTGWVRNAQGTVEIEAQAAKETLDTFVAALRRAPAPARVIDVREQELPEQRDASFEIVASRTTGVVRASLPPDLAACRECRDEFTDPASRRYAYPFTACARCGPRHSVVLAMPYDRGSTTMGRFALCAACRKEYEDPGDRRFHAEAIACAECGPSMSLLDAAGRPLGRGSAALVIAASVVAEGGIVALRGIGGFQLVVDATSERAVEGLRRVKHREDKPFALLFANLEQAKAYATLCEVEERLLTSTEAPIVLARRRADAIPPLAGAVAPHNPEIGCMLPASPLHQLFASEVNRPVVCTSGNTSGEPLCIDTDDAIERLAGIADAFLTHDRPIARPLDDSVVRVSRAKPEILRRARGYAPRAIAGIHHRRPVLAVGGHLKAAPALITDGQLVLGQHVGDLDDRRTFEAFEKSVRDLVAFFRARPEIVACDLHPDYASTVLAGALAASWNARRVSIQHHQAHVAAVAVEHHLDEPALGIAWDGSGIGTDGTVWGSEFFLFDRAQFRRFAHLRPYRLPGGDRAARQPWRSAVGALATFDRGAAARVGRRWARPEDLRVVLDAIDRGVNAPVTTSMGRLFDAVAALVGIRSRCSFEGQAAMELEFAARRARTDDGYPLPLREGEPLVGDWEPVLSAAVEDISRGVDPELVAGRFHASLVDFAIQVAERADRRNVVLAGGCFQNRLLAESLVSALQRRGHHVLTAGEIPCNDGGLAAGQAYLACQLDEEQAS